MSLDSVIGSKSRYSSLAAKLDYRVISSMERAYNALKGVAEYTKEVGRATIDQLVSAYKTRKERATLLPFDYSTGMSYDSLSEMVHNRLQDVWSNASESVRDLIKPYLGLGAYSTKKKSASSRYKRDGFTLTELLVVIGIIGLLTGISIPVAQRVRKKARAVACQSNLHEWGLTFEAYKLFDFQDSLRVHEDDEERPWWLIGGRQQHYYGDKDNPMLCPMAVKLGHSEPSSLVPLSWYGSKFSAWGYKDWQDWQDKDWRIIAGSYGINKFFGYQWRNPPHYSRVPLLLDGVHSDVGLITSLNQPPEEDDIYVLTQPASHFCVNRHDRYINVLFADGHVRKVGLKELWTLKWHRRFDTAGLWTKAGREQLVDPPDWPKWMRGFKDY